MPDEIAYQPTPQRPRRLGLAVGLLMLFAYAGFLVLTFFLTDGFLLRLLREHYVFFVGLPIAALISFVIVSTFETTRGDIQFELGGLKFKGASGPIVMWVLAYVTLIASVSLVWPLH